MRIRITIEYDPQWIDDIDTNQAVVEERQAWYNGDVDVHDVVDVYGERAFTLELVKE